MQKSLRPNKIDLFVGQEKIKKVIMMIIDSAKKQRISIEHMIFNGPPGLGKTTLASIVASLSKKQIRFTQGSLLEKKADLLSIFSSISKGDIIFIDEIHSISKNLEELLYLAMEDYKIDLIIGPEGEQRAIRMELPPFTLIGATTKLSSISKPLLDRFGYIAYFQKYSTSELIEIIQNSASKLNCQITKGASKIIADNSEGTPRIANKLLKRCNDFIISNNFKKIDTSKVYRTLNIMGIYPLGLNEKSIHYLKILDNNFKRSFISISVISKLLNEAKNIIINEIEPALIKNDLIEINSRGRRIKEKGIKYIKLIKINIV